MQTVSVIGLGLMGAALAKTLQASGVQLTVWNRDPNKMKPLMELGASAADTLAEAVQASQLIVICINDYPTTYELFDEPDVASQLDGRTIVQLSTSAPKETVESEIWFNEKGTHYIDGAILGSPLVIGTDDGHILMSGKETVWNECQAMLQCLAGKIQYLGENIRAASTLDLAFLTQRYGEFASVTHALLLCEAEGVSADTYATTVADDFRAKRLAGVVASGDYSKPTATLSVWRAALGHIKDHAQDAPINSEFPDFIDDLLTRAEHAGYGNEDIAALFKVLQSA